MPIPTGSPCQEGWHQQHAAWPPLLRRAGRLNREERKTLQRNCEKADGLHTHLLGHTGSRIHSVGSLSGDVVLQDYRYAVQRTTRTRGLTLVIEHFRLSQGRRVHLKDSTQGRSLEIHFIDTCKVSLVQVQDQREELNVIG